MFLDEDDRLHRPRKFVLFMRKIDRQRCVLQLANRTRHCAFSQLLPDGHRENFHEICIVHRTFSSSYSTIRHENDTKVNCWSMRNSVQFHHRSDIWLEPFLKHDRSIFIRYRSDEIELTRLDIMIFFITTIDILLLQLKQREEEKEAWIIDGKRMVVDLSSEKKFLFYALTNRLNSEWNHSDRYCCFMKNIWWKTRRFFLSSFLVAWYFLSSTDQEIDMYWTRNE